MADEPNDTTPPVKTPAVTFDTEAAFLHAVGERAKQATRAAVAAAKAETFAALGIESEDEIPAIKAMRESSGKTKTEADVLSQANKRLAAELAESRKVAEGLMAYRTTTIRDSALRKHAGKFRDFDDLVAHASARVVVGDDGAVDEKALEVEVENLLKAKPHLRATDFKGGAGTTATGGRSAPTNGANGKPLSPTAKFVAEIAAIHAGTNNRS